MNRLEDSIRDRLAENLAVIERGLTLVKKEFRLKNPEGAGGRIDIVAKDRYGHFVVIEIKRSNQVARQALNEIHKYTALFRLQQGLDEKGLRLIVVSTEWHELLTPLKEFASTSKYSVEGVGIKVDESGKVEECAKIDLFSSSEAAQLEMSACQFVYLFEAQRGRDEHAKGFAKSAQEAGIHDFVLLHFNYRGGNPMVCYPYASYFCFSSPLAGLAESDAELIKSRYDWDDELLMPDENFLSAMDVSSVSDVDDVEVGYPDKLTNIIQEWELVRSSRFGRFSEEVSVFDEKQLIDLARMISSGSEVYFRRISSPRFLSGWESLRQGVDSILVGDKELSAVALCILDEVAELSPEATVSVSVFHPQNLVMGLYCVACAEDYSRLPTISIFIEDVDSGVVRVVKGGLAWRGGSINSSPSRMIASVFGGQEHFTMANVFHSTSEYESKALRFHGLTYSFKELSIVEGSQERCCELRVRKGKVARLKTEDGELKSFADFANLERDYLKRLELHLDEFVVGLKQTILTQSKPFEQ